MCLVDAPSDPAPVPTEALFAIKLMALEELKLAENTNGTFVVG
jgi:hypothetical protein